MTCRTLKFLRHLYTKQTASGNFYLGSHVESAGFEDLITMERIAAYASVFLKAVPFLAGLNVLRFFTGFRPMCADDLPVIGPVPGCAGLLIVSGHGPAGVRYSAATGKAVSDIIAEGGSRAPIEALSVDRFLNG
jgi:glycine/D-amino acid oxidase-like deaminating enzyme